MEINNDVKTLRELGKEFAEAAAHESNKRKIALWKKLNGLKDTRPMATIDQLPWNELNVNDELTARCGDRFLRSIEMELRRQLYQYRHFPVDMVLLERVDIPKIIRNWGYGVATHTDKAVTDPSNSVVGQRFQDVLPDDESVDAMQLQTLGVDPEADKRRLETAGEIFHGILPVRSAGTVMHCGVWDAITMSRSPEHLIYDLVDRPEFMLKLVNKYVDIAMNLADQAEELGLFDVDAPLIHCTGAFTDELPSVEYDGVKAKAKDVWGFGLAQIFSTISPEMHDQFEIQPVKRLLDRFGLMYYGCCDPMDRKIDIVRKLKTVRKISVSPWADKERAAANIHGDFVFSSKPTPANLAFDNFDPEVIRAELRDVVAACKRHNTTCEFVLKDVSTVRYQPERLTEWGRVAMEVASEW